MKQQQQKNLGVAQSFTPGKSLKFKILAVVLLAMIFLEVGTLYFVLWQELQQDTKRLENNFSLVTDILQKDITRWLNNRQNDVLTISQNPMVISEINNIVAGRDGADLGKNKLSQYWTFICQQYGIYDEIYFANSQGKIIISTDKWRENTSRPVDAIISTPLKTGAAYLQNAYLSYKNQPCIAFSVPIMSQQPGEGFLGVLVFRVEIEEVIKPILTGNVNLGKTGQIILVDENQRTITELRDQPGSTLKYKLNLEPVRRVSQGENGVWQGRWLNQEETICAYRYITLTRWGILVCQESSELYAAIYEQAKKSLIITAIISTLALIFIYLYTRRSLKPMEEMVAIAEDISQGNFTRRMVVEKTDEVSLLGHSLNDMADNLDKQFRFQENRRAILQSLVATLDLEEMLNQVLNSVCQNFNLRVGAVYLHRDEADVLECKAFYCPGGKLAEKQKIIGLNEGLEGLAYRTRKIQVLTEVSDDTVYTINWLGNEIKPSTIFQAPIVIGQEVLGVLSLASLHRLSEQEIEEITSIATLLGVAVNNAQAYAKSCDLSEQLQETNEQLSQQNEELNAQSEELQSQSEELMSQSEEMQQITLELQSKNDQLVEMSQRRMNFMATLSHELRAPLNAVIGFSDVLLDQVVGKINPEQKRYLEEIYNSGNHLLGLINDLLDISKIEANQVKFNITEIDPSIPLAEAIAMVSGDIKRKKLRIYNLLTNNSFKVLADASKLKQIFINLLTNAVKFTPEQGYITIGGKEENEEIQIWVADTGIGIAPAYHQTIFEEFKQAPNTLKGGTGLGLPITKMLLELQGGRIEVESQEGKGAKLIITLPGPIKKMGPAVRFDSCAIKEMEAANPAINIKYLTKPIKKEELLCLLEEMSSKSKDMPKVLVVDDELAVRQMVTAMLENRYQVLAAKDGLTGMELAFSQQPDIILLDICMPVIDGFQVMNIFHAYHWQKTMNVLICTSKDLTQEEKYNLAGRKLK
ncbi:ATP-binding protein [Desulfotomaculum sp. 1211_IL3151]|uniref:ATP-binding protein n=1 Tax=Desulfotomaculum sp. 1211_IL3151 TaxID=3084055 RepID=UPI002FD8C0C2